LGFRYKFTNALAGLVNVVFNNIYNSYRHNVSGGLRMIINNEVFAIMLMLYGFIGLIGFAIGYFDGCWIKERQINQWLENRKNDKKKKSKFKHSKGFNLSGKVK
jgi:hypothetical protein